MRKSFLLYLLAVLVVVFASFVVQKSAGVPFTPDWYQVHTNGILSQSIDDGDDAAYTEMLRQTFERESHTVNPIKKFSLSYVNNIDMYFLMYALLIFILSLPLVLATHVVTYAQVFIAALLTAALSLPVGIAASMNWFGYYGGLDGLVPIIIFAFILPVILLFETIGLLSYIYVKRHRKISIR